MRTLTKLAALAVPVAVLLAWCGGGGPETSGSGVKVVATTTQIGALVREIAGENVELTVLLSAGADAHDFDPSPQAVRRANEADVVLKNGLGLDDWVDGLLEDDDARDALVVVTEGIEVREGEESEAHGEEDEDAHAHEDDPHVWHDPLLAKVMVDNIVAALSEADPDNAALFAQNGAAYKQTLDETDAQVRALIDSIPEGNRKVVTNHDAFGYFLDRYGLDFVGAVIPSSNKDAQASAKELAALEDLIRAEGVKAIFSEAEVDPKVAKELASDTGVTIVEGLYADSLGKEGSGADTIHGMLLFNAQKFAEALRQ